MYQAVSGVYAKVRTGGMHWVIWPLSVVRDDDVWSGRIDDQATLIDMGNYNYDSSFWGTQRDVESVLWYHKKWPMLLLNRWIPTQKISRRTMV